MIYTLYKLPNEPIVVLRIRPPMHLLKDIYMLDDEVARIAQKLDGPLVRIDDFSLLSPHDFTFADAIMWLTGILREENYWEGPIDHIAVAPDHILELTYRIYEEGIANVRVPLFPDMDSALSYARMKTMRQ